MAKQVVEEEDKPKNPCSLKASDGLTGQEINSYFVKHSLQMDLAEALLIKRFITMRK